MAEIPSYFQRYLKNIQPSRSSRELAMQLHRTLRERLAADKDFQDWYAETFLYGSYRRNTAIKQIKDVDLCVVLDIEPNDHDPTAVIARLRRVLERNGYTAKTALQRRSIRIDMSSTTLDVVPVVEAEDGSYLIPDRVLKEWVPTHPKKHLESATTLNKDGNQRYVPFVKIVKAWYRYQRLGTERPKPKGFTVEALVAQYQDADAPSYGEAFVNFLSNLDNACGSSLAKGTLPDVADPGVVGATLHLTFTTDEVKQFGKVVKASLEQARTALAAEGVTDSAVSWNVLFGSDFATTPATKAFFKGQAVAEEYEVEDEVSKEIEEIDLLISAPAPLVQAKDTSLGLLRMKARLARQQNGETFMPYPSNGWPLDKDLWVEFSIAETSVRAPYQIRWIVENHGKEAKDAGQLGHTCDDAQETTWRSTAYRGSHRMICELHRSDLVLARAKYIVNVKR